MRARLNLLFVFVAVTIVAALGTAWQQRHIRRELESSLAVLARKRSADDVARHNPARFHVVEKNRETFETAFMDSPNPKADSPITPAAHPLEILHGDPGVQVLWLASRRALVAATYGPLFRSLALTPSQIETFQAITIRREEQAMDLAAAMRTQGLAHDDPSAVALRQKAVDEERAARLALLGPQGYRALQEYLRMLPIREWVGALAGVAAVSGAPFSAERTSQLIPLLAGASRDYLSGGTANLDSIDWDVADRLARTVLSAEQFAMYETVEPEGRGGRFRSRLAQALERARKMEAATAGEN